MEAPPAVFGTTIKITVYIRTRIILPLQRLWRCRFISEDSYEGQIDNPLSLNLYTYVQNNPLIYVDPTGHYMQGDENLGLSKEDQAKITQYGDNWTNATTDSERQYWHDAATVVRANYSTTVNHTDYSAGITSTIYIGRCDVDNSILSPPDLATNLIPAKASAGLFVAGIKVSAESVDKWIVRNTYREIVDTLGQRAAQKFTNAMAKGIVGAKGANGIKYLGNEGVKVGGNVYHYEIKVLGDFGDWRVFGNKNGRGQLIFDKFATGKH